jgi:hypothetical protein
MEKSSLSDFRAVIESTHRVIDTLCIYCVRCYIYTYSVTGLWLFQHICYTNTGVTLVLALRLELMVSVSDLHVVFCSFTQPCMAVYDPKTGAPAMLS